MTSSRWVLVLMLPMLLAAQGSGALGESGADQARQPPLVFGTEVSLVLMPVFVSDKDGHAATGLTAADFSVEDEGKKLDIVSFRFVDTTAEAEQDDIKQASAARRRFLLLFDKSFTNLNGLVRARNAASIFVQRDLAPSDLAAVATFDALGGIKLVANFTDDRALLAHAVQSLGVPSLTKISDPLGLAADFGATDLARARANESEIPQELLATTLSVLARQMRVAEDQAYKNRVSVLLASLAELGNSLRRLEGRKQVLFFSTGFNSAMLVGQDTADQKRAGEAIAAGRIWEVDADQHFGDSRLREELADSLRTLSRADAVLHSIDLSGLGQREDFNQLPPDGMPTRDASGRESLGIMAAETGGRLFKDANDLRPVLREMAEMTSRYYVLGIQPRDTPRNDGSFHKLRVKLAHKGLRLSHRPGYFEKSPARIRTAMQKQFEASELIMSGAEAAGIDFRTLVVPVPSDSEKQRLGIVMQVPKRAFPGGDASASSLELYGYAVAEDGTVMDHFAQLVRLEAGQRDWSSFDGVSFVGQFVVPAGRYTLRLMAQEPESGLAGVRFLDVTVPKRDLAAGFLLPPLAIEDASRWLRLSMKSSALNAMPFDIAGEAFVPKTEIEIMPGRLEKLVLIAYEPGGAQNPAADIDIRSVLSDAGGKRYAPGFITIEKVHRDAAGRRSYVLGYVPENLAPGDYTLRMHIGEARSVLESYCRLKVVARSPSVSP